MLQQDAKVQCVKKEIFFVDMKGLLTSYERLSIFHLKFGFLLFLQIYLGHPVASKYTLDTL